MTLSSTETATRPEQTRSPEGPARIWHDHRDLPVAGTQPPRSASAAEVILAYLRLQAHALRSLEPAVRADEDDAVHQMRVATRRLRAALRSFGQPTRPAHGPADFART